MRLQVLFSVSLCLAAVSFSCAFKTYQGYELLEIVPRTAVDLERLQNVYLTNKQADFWKPPSKIDKPAHVFASSQVVKKILSTLESSYYQLLSKDVDGMIRNERKAMEANPLQRDFALDQYHSHDEINAWLQNMAMQHSDIASVFTVGYSTENRSLSAIKIGVQSANSKPAVWIDAGIHAREWVAPATALYIVSELLTNTTQYRTLLEKIDFYVLPSMNPDGYEYTRSTDRLWRKTRSGPHCLGQSCCVGADPNRNFGFMWGDQGTSTDPCTNLYIGPSPLSEPECLAVGDFLLAHKHTVKAYLTLHAYGEDWVYPWGYTMHTYPPDVQDLRRVALRAGAAIKAVHNTTYDVGNSGDDLYPAAGASDDWSKAVPGVKYVYTIELRPGPGDHDNIEHYGFVLPPQYIIRTADEAWAGLLVVAMQVAADGL